MNAPELDQIILLRGSHDEPPDGCDNPEACLFEWYNWLASQRHTDDRPADVSPVLHTYGMNLNDVLGDDRRQELKRFLPLPGHPSPLAGTFGDGLDETRSYMALDWLVRTYTPVWLDLVGLTAEAAALRDLRRIVDLVAVEAAGPVVRDACENAAAAGDAAATAGWAAAWDAAGAAARAAATWATTAATTAAGWAAAWAAAGDAAGDAAAWAAATVAAWDAAGDAITAAAGDAITAAARAAAGDAAPERLAQTVDLLQTSAIALYVAMIHPAL
jgi:hypothetical protein